MPETTYSYSATIDRMSYLLGVIDGNGILDTAGVEVVSWSSVLANQFDITLSDALSTSDKATFDEIIGSYFPATIIRLEEFTNGFDLQQFRDEVEADATITANILFMDIQSSVININFDAELTSSEQTALDSLVANFVARNDTTTTTNGYIILNSSLADSGAIVIKASDTVGGIDIDAGTGGIAIDTTNAVSIDAGAESNFSTSTGNLILNSAGLLKLDSDSQVNVGCESNTPEIDIGTGATVRTLLFGNTTGATSIQMDAGTGGITLDTTDGGTISLDAIGAASNFTIATNAAGQDLTIGLTGATDSSIVLTSAGTGADAIKLDATGGLDIDTGGTMNFNTTSTAANAFRFDASGASGFDIDVGTSGFDLDTTGEINLATSKAAGGSITFDANSGGVTISGGSFGIAINSGTGLIGIGHWSAGNIDFGTSATARQITIGNTTGATGLKLRQGTGGFVRYQPAPASLGAGNQTITAAQILKQILSGTPTLGATVTLPSAADMVSAISGIAVDDSIDFSVISNSALFSYTLSAGSGGSEVGNMTVSASTSGAFRLRFTNVTSSSEAYTVYRIA